MNAPEKDVTEFRHSRGLRIAASVICAVLIIGMYAYGAVVTSTCIFDRSAPQAYTPAIENLWVGKDKWKTYHIELSPYGNHTKSSRMMIRAPLFRQLTKGSEIRVLEKPGAFGIPWRRLMGNWNPDGTSGE